MNRISSNSTKESLNSTIHVDLPIDLDYVNISFLIQILSKDYVMNQVLGILRECRCLTNELISKKRDDTVFGIQLSPIASRDTLPHTLVLDSFMDSLDNLMETTQRKREKRGRALFEHITDSVLIVNPSGSVILDVNQPAANLLGYIVDELIGMSLLQVMIPSEISDSLQRISILRAGKRLPVYQTTFRNKNGEEIPVELDMTMIFNSKDHPLHLQVIARDIRSQLQIENQLRCHAKLWDNLLDAVITTDMYFCIKSWNPAAQGIYGWHEEEVLGKHLGKLLLQEFPYHQMDDVGSQLSQVGTWQGEVTQKRKDTTPIKVSITLSRIDDDNGTPTGFLIINRDITAHKLMEQALQKANVLSEQLINSSTDGIFAFDRECRFTIWNPAMERGSGFLKEKVLGKYVFNVFPFLKETGEDHYLLDTLIGKTSIIKDRSYLAPTDQQLFYEAHNSPLQNEKGEIVGGFTYIRNVTRRTETEEQLQESEYRYRTLYETIQGGIVAVGIDGRIIECNQTYATMLGYSKDELRLFPSHQLTAPLSNQFEETIIRPQLMSRGHSDVYEKTHIRIDGSTFIGSIRAWLNRGKDGKPESVWSIVQDITSQKITENSLKESEIKFSTLVEHVKDGVVIVQDNVFKFVNQAVAEDFGYTIDELIGRPFLDVVLPQYRSVVVQRHQARMAGKKISPIYVTKLCCKDGTIKEVEISAGLIQFQGKLANMGIIRDITQRKKTEAIHLDLEVRRGQFIEVTSHEIRTPLTALRGFTEILEHRWYELDEESRTRSFDAIRRNIRRLERLAEGVSNLGQIERTTLQLNMEVLNFCKFLTEALQEYQITLQDQLGFNSCSENLSAFIMADADRLTQVLDNLIENAINNTATNQRQIRVISEVLPDIVRISISDNGAGIAPSDLERIFGQFISIPTDHHAQGTGIGLYISRAIVMAHGGTLVAQSKGKGQGASFILTIPRKTRDIENVE